MKFDKPAGINPIDQLKVVGRPTQRIDGPVKTTGTAKYAYEYNSQVRNPAYAYIVGAAIAKGRINAIHESETKAAPGVLAVITAENAGPLQTGKFYVDGCWQGHR
jgi:xanthine dehydrogenase YagR molybdenum-binding subunit